MTRAEFKAEFKAEDKLIQDLAAPTFTLRMALHDSRKGAEKRAENARQKIRGIVQSYILEVT